MVGLLIIVLCISWFVFLEERIHMGTALKEREYYCEQLEMLTVRYEELRKFRHDYINRMIVIDQMLETKQYDSVKRYMALTVEKLEQGELYCESGYIPIDSVINCKLNSALQQEICVYSDVVLPSGLSFNDDDMVVILGNLLDNAIEAAKKYTEERFVMVELYYEQGVLVIRVENSWDGSLCSADDVVITRKQHTKWYGIGLHSVHTTVRKYDGLLEVEHTEKSFVVNVLLYL